MSDIPDVDIEVKNRDDVAKLFPEAIVASQIANNRLVRHNSGLYFQNIPVHPLSGLAALPYEEAEDIGFYKVDLLSCPFPYQDIESMEDLRDLLATPIDWMWFTDADFVSGLFHLNGAYDGEIRFADIVAAYEPKSIMDLAMLIAIKLPGKKHLIGEPWETVRGAIWVKETTGLPQFKKSHSVAYALAVGIDARMKSGYFSEPSAASALHESEPSPEQ
jgi:hypothetical protein